MLRDYERYGFWGNPSELRLATRPPARSLSALVDTTTLQEIAAAGSGSENIRRNLFSNAELPVACAAPALTASLSRWRRHSSGEGNAIGDQGCGRTFGFTAGHLEQSICYSDEV